MLKSTRLLKSSGTKLEKVEIISIWAEKFSLEKLHLV